MKKPSEINIIVPFTEAFGNCEAEYVAVVIVKYCTDHGDTFDQSVSWQAMVEWALSGDPPMMLNLRIPPFINPMVGVQTLHERAWIECVFDNLRLISFRVTEEFVRRVDLSGQRRFKEINIDGPHDV